jgi:hypothetical protein
MTVGIGNAKRQVTQYFRARNAELRLLGGARVRQDSDFLELYVLVRLTALAQGEIRQTFQRGDSRVFRVAGSPSPNWKGASYIQIGALAARTGLQVQCGTATAELDVVLVDPAQVQAGGLVPAEAAVAAFECKAYGGRVQLTHADQMIGKARRVWRDMPLKAVTSHGGVCQRFAGVALNGSAASVRDVLAAEGIGLADDAAQELEALVSALVNVVSAAPLAFGTP